MNYKKELQKMRKHRENYFPVMDSLLHIHKSGKGVVPITNSGDIFIILELIDLGYLEPESFIIQKTFGTIKNVYFAGTYPFTESGQAVYGQFTMKKKIKWGIVIASVICGTGITLILYFLLI